MPQICVIVPVYNAEKYLSHCVDSILNQTFRDFTLLLVDDCSVDKSASICDDYASKDGRVVVIHKEKNAGPGAARNTGLEWMFQHEEFGYISFVDSDDFVSPIYLEILYKLIDRNHAEMSMCAFTGANNYKILEQSAALEMELMSGDSPEKLWCKYRVNCLVVWAKLFKKSLFYNIRFPEDFDFGEDEAVIFKIFFNRVKVPFYPNPLYGYYSSSDSITGKPWSCKRMLQPEAIRKQMRWLMYAGYCDAVKINAKEYIYYLWKNFNAAKIIHPEYAHILKYQLRDALKLYAPLADISMWNSPRYYADAYSVLKPFCFIRLLVSRFVPKRRIR